MTREFTATNFIFMIHNKHFELLWWEFWINMKDVDWKVDEKKMLSDA